MGGAGGGAKEVMVKVTGGGRDADGVQAHVEYIDRHGKLDIETDRGETLQGKTAATQVINDWSLNYGDVPGAPHSRQKVSVDGERKKPRQAFNIILSMPAGTPPAKVLQAVKRFAREEFALQHRYAMALHANMKDGHGKNPHVHLVVKAEHENGGKRLNPRKADLARWRERFAQHLNELGVAATATRRNDRGLTKTAKKTPIYRATQRDTKGRGTARTAPNYYTAAGDSVFMRKKLEAVAREVRAGGRMEDREGTQALLNVRAQVTERYREAIEWLRTQGREDEAQRLEMMHRNLPPVRTEQQLIAERLIALSLKHKEQSRQQDRIR